MAVLDQLIPTLLQSVEGLASDLSAGNVQANVEDLMAGCSFVGERLRVHAQRMGVMGGAWDAATEAKARELSEFYRQLFRVCRALLPHISLQRNLHVHMNGLGDFLETYAAAEMGGPRLDEVLARSRVRGGLRSMREVRDALRRRVDAGSGK